MKYLFVDIFVVCINSLCERYDVIYSMIGLLLLMPLCGIRILLKRAIYTAVM